jgi:hypothetical protein
MKVPRNPLAMPMLKLLRCDPPSPLVIPLSEQLSTPLSSPALTQAELVRARKQSLLPALPTLCPQLRIRIPKFRELVSLHCELRESKSQKESVHERSSNNLLRTCIIVAQVVRSSC